MATKSSRLLLIACLSGVASRISGFEVELKEIVNPAVALVQQTGEETTCAPDGCKGILTRDGDLSEDSRYSCVQPSADSDPCDVTYRMYEVFSTREPVTLSSVYVAFAADSKTSLKVLLDDEVIVEAWTGEEGSTALQAIGGLEGYSAEELTFEAIIEEGEWLGITETEIYIEVAEVAITGISASDRVTVVPTATVNDDDAGRTLDGNTSKKRAWSCETGDTCEIVYDMQSVQSVEQVLIAFVGKTSTVGATFNLYTAGVDGIYSQVISGGVADARDESLEGLQTFGGVRKLARYVMIEGITGTGGKISITEVDIRISEDDPSYPTTVNTIYIPSGRLPNGDAASDERPASEGGCTAAGPFEGCDIFNIKDGDDSANSRWSCGPEIEDGTSSCVAEFDLNTNRYLRQIQLAFYEGDERHSEFSIWVQHNNGWVAAVDSAISSGETTDYQTWDLKAYTNKIQIRPKFGEVADTIDIMEMILLEKETPSDATPILGYQNYDDGFESELPSSELKKTFRFDLEEVGDEGTIDLGGRGQKARITAIKMKFPNDRAFVFDITWRDDDFESVYERFASAGGEKMWETFELSEAIDVSTVSIVAVEGPDEEDYPTLRVRDCKVVGSPYNPDETWVVSTANDFWNAIPDVIGDGIGDQEEIMTAICNGIGQVLDGMDCDGEADENVEHTVHLAASYYYLDGPVYVKSGVDLEGQFFTDDGELTELIMTTDGGVDGILIADNVSGVGVSEIVLRSADETASSLCIDVKDSSDINLEEMQLRDCSAGGARFADSSTVTIDNIYGSGADTGNMLVLQGVTDYYLTRTIVNGMLIEDSTDVVVETGNDDEFGDPIGDIRVPGGGDQTANLVVTGSSSGVALKGIDIRSGAEPRILLESTNPFTLDAVVFVSATTGECLVQVPEGSGDDILVQLNVVDQLELSGNSCFVLA